MGGIVHNFADTVMIDIERKIAACLLMYLFSYSYQHCIKSGNHMSLWLTDFFWGEKSERS